MRKYDWEDSTITYMVSHMAIHKISREGKVIVKLKPELLETQIKGIFTKL